MAHFTRIKIVLCFYICNTIHSLHQQQLNNAVVKQAQLSGGTNPTGMYGAQAKW